MKFNYFRIFITLLAALSCFFAYLCRLNLSMTIEEMVVKHDILDPQLDPVHEELAELARHLPKMRTEEQTMAQLSTGPWWLRKRRTFRNRTLARSAQNRIKQMSASIQGLSIEFDISSGNGDNGKNRSTSNGAQGPAESGQKQPADKTMPEAQQDQTFGVQQNLLSWNKEARNELLGAFFVGYVIFQIPCGRAAEIFGPKLLFLWLAVGTGLSSLVFPLAAKWFDGIVLAYIVRFIMGASQAGLFPAAYVTLCEWLPKSERSSWLAVPSAMGRIGTITMNLTVPFIMAKYGWEMVFYVSGCVTLIWGAIFLIFGADSPATSRWISSRELMYIEARIEPRVGTLTKQTNDSFVTGSGFTINQSAKEAGTKPAIDWLKMIKNRPLLVLTLVMFTSEWSNMLLLVKLPGFLGPALGMDVAEIGMWSSILLGVYCVQYPLSGVCAARLEAAEIEGLDSLRVRKIFEAVAHALQAAGCLMIALSGSKLVVVMALFVIMLGRSTVGGGQCLMPPELSKDYPGSVIALANSLANMAGIIGPMTVSALVAEPTNYESWRSLWLLSAGLFTFGGLIFCLFAQNEPQNYCKQPKHHGPSASISQAQLFPTGPLAHAGASGWRADSAGSQHQQGKDEPPPADGQRAVAVDEQILKMDAFARVANEPEPTRIAAHPSASGS